MLPAGFANLLAISLLPCIRTGVPPHTYGSALFIRGEAQALVSTTLGTERDSQIIDALEGERREHTSSRLQSTLVTQLIRVEG